MAKIKNVGKITMTDKSNIKTGIKNNTKSSFGATSFKFFVRAVQYVVTSLIVGIICLLIGNTCLPIIAYQMSAGFGLEQGTNLYVAFASWMLPMLFYMILISAGTLFLLKFIIKKIHTRFNAVLEKFENKRKGE